jgi:putative lipoic acid-binding regulatory protein
MADDETSAIDPDAHKIKFPALYPIKVVGTATEDFRDYVVAVMERHAGALLEEHIDVKPSSNGRFLSVRVTIMATGPDQLQTIFEELKASGRVHIVL